MPSTTSIPMMPRLTFNLRTYHQHVETHISDIIRNGRANPQFVYDFYIDALGRELEAVYNSDTVNLSGKAEKFLLLPGSDEIHPEGLRRNGTLKKFDLTDWNVACCPQKKVAVPFAIQQVQEEGYRIERQPENNQCEGFVYPLLRFAVVTNARHHAVAARVVRDKGLTMNASVVDISEFFSDLRVGTDFSWYSQKRKFFMPRKPDPRFALMYDLARRKTILATSPDTFFEQRDELCSLIEVEEDFIDVEVTENIFAPLTESIVQPPKNLVADKSDLPAIKRLLLRLMGLNIERGWLHRKG